MRRLLSIAAGMLLGALAAVGTNGAFAAPVRPVTTRLCADYQKASMTRGSGTSPFTVVTCGFLRSPGTGQRWVIVNDGADNDFDAGDVLLGFPTPVTTPTASVSGHAG